MFIETATAQGQDTGWYNLDRMDRIEILSPAGENYVEIKLTQGTTTKTVFVSNTSMSLLMRYLRSTHTHYH